MLTNATMAEIIHAVKNPSWPVALIATLSAAVFVVVLDEFTIVIFAGALPAAADVRASSSTNCDLKPNFESP